ncbi:MAG TPA: HisA/HisF-related TIM barrel protein, partial [Xanthomonadales bacterium]|nr:HisA/HisF-related TIM barrel protein [Xanthomonadales bacterium]
QIANRYADAGAEWLHLVDLAASRDGAKADPQPVLQLLSQASQRTQVGGGVRNFADVQKRLEAGADRVVVGTICVKQTGLFSSWLAELGPERLVSALDVVIDAEGAPWPQASGWTEAGDRNLWDVLDELCAAGLKHLLCTDISKDGALKGPNLGLYSQLHQRYPDLHVQASGGISGLRDLEDLKLTGATSAISGKALLEGCFTVEEALEVLA